MRLLPFALKEVIIGYEQFGKFFAGLVLLSHAVYPLEIRELYKEYNFFDFKRVHSMAQKYEAGKEFPELLIANYDLFERERQKPYQLTLFDSVNKPMDYKKILKENIICRMKR